MKSFNYSPLAKWIFLPICLSVALVTTSCGDDEDDPVEPPIIGSYDQYCPDDNHPHAIDLGLPSGTKWACCNVGANAPEESGGHYAWGETTERNEYSLNTYLYCTQIDGKQIYAYLGDNIAGSIYDVAHVKMGGSWSMPTQEQIAELRDCKWTWSVKGGKNGTMNGYKVKGNNGAFLFLPAAGIYYGSSLQNKGKHGGYWSSNPFPSVESIAYIMMFTSDTADSYDIQGREKGMSVRAVCK